MKHVLGRVQCYQYCLISFSSVHGILQARILEWVATPTSKGSSRPRDRTQVSHIAGRFFIVWATRDSPLPPLHSFILQRSDANMINFEHL